MGLTVLNLEVANPRNPQQTETVEFLIDSGAIYSVVPRRILDRLGINPVSQNVFRLASGQTTSAKPEERSSSTVTRQAWLLSFSEKKATARFWAPTRSNP